MHICYVDERAPACMYVCVCVCVNVWLYILIYWHQLWPHSIEYLIMWNWGLPIKLWYVGFGSVKPNRTAEEAPASVTNYDDVLQMVQCGTLLTLVAHFNVYVCVCVFVYTFSALTIYFPTIHPLSAYFPSFFPFQLQLQNVHQVSDREIAPHGNKVLLLYVCVCVSVSVSVSVWKNIMSISGLTGWLAGWLTI